MFRKPKNKSAIRQRKNSEGEASDEVAVKAPQCTAPVSVPPGLDGFEDDGDTILSKKKSSLLSFEHDEEDGEEFTLKKNKKRLKEAKRLKKLEEKAKELQVVDVKQEIEEETLETRIVSQKAIKEEPPDADENSHRFVPRAERERRFKKEADIVADRKLRQQQQDEDNDVHEKFQSSLGTIPDSKAVYEARKKRERLRQRGHDGFIPLDDDQKLRDKGARQRLVREDENDDSDSDNEKFYSSRALAIEEENRRREQQHQFLEHEQGDQAADSDDEAERWERQQILKAVGATTIGQMRHEYEQSAEIFHRKLKEDEERHRHVEMDIDMDVDEPIILHSASKDADPGATHVTMQDIMSKLALRMRDREESMNTLRANVDKIASTIDENKNNIRQMECAGPVLAEKFKMYQMMKAYVRSLLDCLDEKVADINSLVDRKRALEKSRIERLMRRRRRDVRDAYDECCAAAAGKNAALIRIGEHGARAAEREARRGRRRREREGQLAGISHEEGLSSDDEETTSQTVADSEANEKLNAEIDTVFVDALDDYSNMRKVLDHIIDWLSVDSKSFEDAYVHLCIPKLVSPYVRLQLCKAAVLKDASFRLDTQPWYRDALEAGSAAEIDPEHHVVVGLVPAIVEKVVVPFLTDVVNEEWDPLSLKQTQNLTTLLATLVCEYPTITARSKPVGRLVEAIQRRAQGCIDEDLFVPMYSKQAIENPNTGCRAFLDRQFWAAIKMMRSLSLFSCILSASTMYQLVFESVAARSVALALQMGDLKDQSTINKVRALISEVRPEWFSYMTDTSTRSLISVLTKVSEEQESKNRDFARETRKFVDRLKNRA